MKGKFLQRSTLLCLYLLVTGPAWSADQNIFKPLSSNPQNLYAFNNYIYCTANDGMHGIEVWRVSVPDGVAELVADVVPGLRSHEIDTFYAFKGSLYFRVKNPETGAELWRSDGLPNGRTERVHHFNAESEHDGLAHLYGHVGDTLVLGVGNLLGSWSVWFSDGTTAGTYEFGQRRGIGLSSRTKGSVVWNEELYFGGEGGTSGGRFEGLWKTDGTLEGTSLVLAFDDEPGIFATMGDKGILFSGYTKESGSEPWITLGTPESTKLVKDIWEGPESSSISEMICAEDPSGQLAPRVYFGAADPELGKELWESDGTPTGTKRAFDIAPGAASSAPYKFRKINGRVYFIAATEESGKELWYLKFSGEPTCTQLTDIIQGPLGSEPYEFAVRESSPELVFSAHGPQGEELWVSDGTPESTICYDIYEGPGSSEPYHTVEVGMGFVVFSAMHPVYGRELWYVDARGPKLLCDLCDDLASNPSSSPTSLTPLGDRLLFVADDIEHGRELWVTQADAKGAVLLKDIYPGEVGSQPEHLTVVGNYVYFAAESPGTGTELYRSNGTPEGTGLVIDIYPAEMSSGPKHLFAWKGALYFSAFRPNEGEELWSIQPGRMAEIVANIRPGAESSYPKNFVIWNDNLYFQADDGTHGEELWRTDGTAAGTVMVVDVVATPYEKMSYGEVVPYGDRLYLSATTANYGQELFVLRDLEKGPRLVEDIALPLRLRAQGTAP